MSTWHPDAFNLLRYYNDIIMDAIASKITSLTIVYSTVYSGADQRKHQSSASLAFVWGIHRWPVNSPHKWPVTRKIFPFDDVIMVYQRLRDISWEESTWFEPPVLIFIQLIFWVHHNETMKILNYWQRIHRLVVLPHSGSISVIRFHWPAASIFGKNVMILCRINRFTVQASWP